MADCTCDKCVGACKFNPGWFAPGEAEKAAELLKVPFEVFRERLITDYWVGELWNKEVEVLAPRKVGVDEDLAKASWSYPFRGATCTFLKNERCEIHEAKPYECRHGMPCQSSKGIREKVAEMWRIDGKRD